MDEQIKILNDERLRLVEGVNAGILSSESVNQRMLEINKIIEDMIKNKDKNPFDKMFPGQSLVSDEAQHTMPDGTMMPGIDHAAYEANRNMMNKGGEARSFPDLTGDGKVTQADILMGRGVKMADGGEMQKYKIEEGDTLTALARKYNVTIEELLRLNPQIKDRNLIYTNRMMTVPGQISTDVGPMQEVDKGIASAFVGPMQEETDGQPTLTEIYNSAKGFMSGLLPDYEGPETNMGGFSGEPTAEELNRISNEYGDSFNNVIGGMETASPNTVSNIGNSLDILGGVVPENIDQTNINAINQGIENAPENIGNVLQDSFAKLDKFDQYIKRGNFQYDSSKLLNDFKNSAQEIASGALENIDGAWYSLRKDFVEELNNFAQNNNLTSIEDLVNSLDMDWLYEATGVRNSNKLNMANGGEIDMAIEDVSRGTMAMPAQEEMQPTQEEITMVQQVMETVMQMVAQGASEEEIVMVLQQMGLDQEDIAMVMQIVAQQMQEAPAPGAAIDAELSQMM